MCRSGPDQYSTLIYLLAYTGMRWGEAAALRRRRIDVLRSRVEIAESVAEIGGRIMVGTPKSGKSRTISVPAFLRDRLNDQLLEASPVSADDCGFTAINGGPLRHSNFRRRSGFQQSVKPVCRTGPGFTT